MATKSTSDPRAHRAGPHLPKATPSLADYLALNGRWHAVRPALIVGETIVSWREFDAATNRVANGLRALGIGPGDMVGVVMSNGRAMAEVLFGILKAGACSVPINISITNAAIATMLEDSGAAAIFATSDQVERLTSVAANVPIERRLCAGGHTSGWTRYDVWAGACSIADPNVRIPADAPCNVIYSSGTTGLPKGIVHDFAGRLDWAYDVSVSFGIGVGTRSLCSIGLYSNIMWAVMLTTLLSGGALIVHERFDARRTLEDIVRHRIACVAMVPVQWQRLVEAGATAAQLASLRTAITLGAPMHEGLKRTLLELMPTAFMELYGLTEGILTVMPPDDMHTRVTSVGKPVPGADLLIIDDHDRPCARGEAGEIVSRARFVMPHYLNRPDATIEAQWRDDEGTIWMRTGDIGRLDEEGFLFVVDRKKDMILSGGQNIYPADIESVLLDHEAVADAAVIGVSDVKWGETPLAVVVAKAGIDLDTDALREWVNQRVGKWQRLRAVALTEVLPRNANGKILKRNLRQTYERNGSTDER
jgi:acyl-CoA synthetase (AMP-forming)/AMP-acid ligase II